MIDDPCLATLCGAIADSELPVLLMEVPSEEVLAASRAALELLSPEGQPVLGHSFEDFTADETTGALPLLIKGRLRGYQATRALKRSGPPLPVNCWITRVDDQDPVRHIVTVLARGPADRGRLLAERPPGSPTAVLGAAGPDLIIDRIGPEVHALLKTPAAALLGRSLLVLPTPACAGDLLRGLSKATTHARGVLLQLDLVGGQGGPVPVQLLIVPLQPPASCAFSILPAGAQLPEEPVAGDLHGLLRHFATGIDGLEVSRRSSRSSGAPNAMGALTDRELDIVDRLVTGDRVPAIARALYLSQSTVRNHLSSVFRKLGVSSQQDLVHLLRKDGPSGPR